MNTEEKTEIEKAQGTEVSFLIPNTETLGKLDKLNPTFSLTLKYKSADDWAALKDKPVRAYYIGMKEIPNEEGDLINCALLVSQTECFLSGQKTLVEAVKNLEPNTPIEITYRNKRNNKSSQGSTMIFDVEKLS